MIIILKQNAKIEDRDQLIKRFEFMGFKTIPIEREGRLAITTVSGIDENTKLEQFQILPFVDKVIQLKQPFKLAGREGKLNRTTISVNKKIIGGDALTIIAGPCAVESEESIFQIAATIAQHGATVLRGGAFKPRTSPYDFQGLGKQGLEYLSKAANQFDLLTISEVMAVEHIELVAQYIDILQIGARNMQNFSLLKAVGKTGKPVMLKRGFSATYKDFLMAAEYVLSEGNPNVILCERGIRTFETYTRNTLDIAAVPVLHQLSHLPIIVDPSHGTGIRSLVMPMARAAIAAGADGIMVEVHTEPDKALSDAKQTISTEMFAELVKSLNAIRGIIR